MGMVVVVSCASLHLLRSKHVQDSKLERIEIARLTETSSHASLRQLIRVFGTGVASLAKHNLAGHFPVISKVQTVFSVMLRKLEYEIVETKNKTLLYNY